jgi:predicted N-acetyltransferase YhbS
MTITTLKDAPHLYQATLSLIEKSFGYEDPHSFAVDFSPLISKENFHHNFIKIDENENVIAHIGVSEREILGFKVAMLGGIAVDESQRGAGHFQDLFQEVISEKKSDVAFFLLWSDQEKLYKKFGFYLCGTQYEVSKPLAAINFTKTKLNKLDSEQLHQIKDLYKKSFSNTYATVDRTDTDWDKILEISSADLFIREQSKTITDYFFMNKGQDLSGIIYEYGSTGDIKNLVGEISVLGKVWVGDILGDIGEAQFQYFLCPGSTKLFSAFVSAFTDKKINVIQVNSMKQEVYFDFNQELLGLEVEEFLRGIFGPGIFEELGTIPSLFISGLDSI